MFGPSCFRDCLFPFDDSELYLDADVDVDVEEVRRSFCVKRYSFPSWIRNVHIGLVLTSLLLYHKRQKSVFIGRWPFNIPFFISVKGQH